MTKPTRNPVCSFHTCFFFHCTVYLSFFVRFSGLSRIILKISSPLTLMEPESFVDVFESFLNLHGRKVSRVPWEARGQGVTKRCRLSWLTNSALVYEPKCGGSCGVSANEYSCFHRSPNKLWRSNSIFHLC
jgi:hypothetical protein